MRPQTHRIATLRQNLRLRRIRCCPAENIFGINPEAGSSQMRLQFWSPNINIF